MGDVIQYIPPSAQRRIRTSARRAMRRANESADLCKTMAAAMRADDFEPLPAFVVQPWKTLDNN